MHKGWFPLRKTFLRTGTDRNVSFDCEFSVGTNGSGLKGNLPVRFCLEECFPKWKPAFRSLVPAEISLHKGNFPVRSCPEENYTEWNPALGAIHTIVS